MTKPLDPDIKAMRAMVRVLAELPDGQSERRVLEWLLAWRLCRTAYALPRFSEGWRPTKDMVA